MFSIFLLQVGKLPAINYQMKMLNMSKLLLGSVLTLFLTGCTSSYQALSSTKGPGYKEQRLNPDELPARYLLSYQGGNMDGKQLVTDFWQRRAGELCPNGYKIVQHEQHIHHGKVRVPINGIMQDIPTQKMVDRGEIECR